MIYRCPVCDQYGVFYDSGGFTCVHENCQARFIPHGQIGDVLYVELVDANPARLTVLRPQAS